MKKDAEKAFLDAQASLEAAQRKFDKAQQEWQNEIDAIVLDPIHKKRITRKEAHQLAKAIADNNLFGKLLELGYLTDGGKGEETE